MSGGTGQEAPGRRSVSSEVTVSVSPQTAFTVFTSEMDLWWVRGPINFFDSARAVRMVCEPGVGGRILEQYDAGPDGALELGTITAWQPGERLAWASSLDDVEVEVTFTPATAGTVVRVQATVPEGGQDRGGTFWQRIVPAWFGAWCGRRDTAPREPDELDRLALAVYYDRPVTAARWLASAFGFDSPSGIPEAAADDRADAHTWLEFRIGHCALVVLKSPDDGPDVAATTHVPWIFVDDLDGHLARAAAAGAQIIEPIRQHGFRSYSAADPEGRRWTFAQARPTMRWTIVQPEQTMS